MAIPNWQCPNEWSEWNNWLAAGLHVYNRWRLLVLLVSTLFAIGLRTVTIGSASQGVPQAALRVSHMPNPDHGTASTK